jgi:DNA replication licensing factor MCM2
MNRRDRLERGGQRGARAARRHRPEFLDSDDVGDDEMDGGLLSGLKKRRVRRVYDERRDQDDMDGVEDVSCRFHSPRRPLMGSGVLQEIPLEQLGDIKAKSIVEWIANERVRRSIIKHFRQFLMTYVDENGASVYGQRIRNLGESTSWPADMICTLAHFHCSEL